MTDKVWAKSKKSKRKDTNWKVKRMSGPCQRQWSYPDPVTEVVSFMEVDEHEDWHWGLFIVILN